MRDDINGMEALLRLSSPLSWFSKDLRTTLKKANEDLESIKYQVEEIMTVNDTFNEVFSADGWIAYETMDFEAMRQATDLY